MDYERFIERVKSAGYDISITQEARDKLREFTRNAIIQDSTSRGLFAKAFQEGEHKSFYVHELLTRVLFLARPPVYMYCRQRFEEAMRAIFSNVFIDRENPKEIKKCGRHGLTMLAFEFFVMQIIEDAITHQHLEDSWGAG